MKGLLTKDFSLFMQRKRFFLLMMVVAAFMSFTSEDVSFVTAWIVMIMSIFALSTISYDEYDNSILFLMTTPILRKTYAVEKYLFGFLSGLAGWFYSLIIVVAKSALTGQEDLMQNIRDMSVFIAVILVMLSLSIPINLKWGSEKGRTVLFLVLGIGFAAMFTLIKLIGDKIDFTGIFADISFNALMTGIALFGVLLTIISMAISIKVVENKEY